MKHNLFFLFILCSCFAKSQTAMFRGSPAHLGVADAPVEKPLTALRWQFEAGSPIRATVCADKDQLYFGTAKGIFYCLDKQSGRIRWSVNTGEAIHSSAAVDEASVYFSNNRQTVFSLDKRTGKTNWQISFPGSKNYDWAFDYFYSSPVLVNGQLLIGIKDGFVYNINTSNGKINWQYKTEGIVRSTPAVRDKVVYFGDTEGLLYALDLANAKEQWRFRTEGYRLKNEDYGFDRKAIISSPAVTEDKVVFGSRDGWLYAVDRKEGKKNWRVDHQVSWVISSPAVKDSIVVTGTSDGHFVQAVNLSSGKEIWRYKTSGLVWSSPLICQNKVYTGSNEGLVYCLDLQTGKRLSSFQTNGKLWSSPVIAGSLLFIGNDKGLLYALQQNAYTYPQSSLAKKMVFYEPDVNGYAKKSQELKAKEYLNNNGFATINSEKLLRWLQQKDSAAGSVIVFATNYFPEEILKENQHSLLRTYLEKGGRVVLLGLNPAVYVRDSATKAITNFNFLRVDAVFGIHYPFNDLRSMKGIQPAFATATGKQWGVNDFWTGFLPLRPEQVDVVLGQDENHLASAWVKRYKKDSKGGLVQLWMDQENEPDLSFVLRAATYGLN